LSVPGGPRLPLAVASRSYSLHDPLFSSRPEAQMDPSPPPSFSRRETPTLLRSVLSRDSLRSDGSGRSSCTSQDEVFLAFLGLLSRRVCLFLNFFRSVKSRGRRLLEKLFSPPKYDFLVIPPLVMAFSLPPDITFFLVQSNTFSPARVALDKRLCLRRSFRKFLLLLRCVEPFSGAPLR